MDIFNKGPPQFCDNLSSDLIHVMEVNIVLSCRGFTHAMLKFRCHPLLLNFFSRLGAEGMSDLCHQLDEGMLQLVFTDSCN